jgi:molybdenum cofactor biosynthesis enzyme MoaA
MKFYQLLKLNQFIKNSRFKFLALLLLHVLKKRYLAVHFDPVNACNFRCKMCYFTDANYVKKLKGIIPENELDYLGEAFFKRAIKLQIGCGTEPTLYKNVTKIIKIARSYQVPYISMTTNGNLLTFKKVEEWAANGLSEITMSLHGVTKITYEDMMTKGDFDKFLNVLAIVTKVKEKYPLKLRINYTFNEDNFKELQSFFTVFDAYDIDILQVRPIVKLGDTAYNNYSLDAVFPIYDQVYEYLLHESKKRKVQLLIHNPSQLSNRKSSASVINKYVYTYISPTSLYHDGFKWNEETYDQYAKRTMLVCGLLKDVFASRKVLKSLKNDKLNYEVN